MEQVRRSATLRRLLMALLMSFAISAHAQESTDATPAPEPHHPLGLPGPPQSKGLPGEPKITTKFPGNALDGIGPLDPRTKVDLSQMPWRAVGRIKVGGASCTGALIAPAMLLTAAHCVFNPLTHQPVAPAQLKFMLGYDDGHYDAAADGVRIITDESYDPVLNIGSMGKDWALVELNAPIGAPDRFLPLRSQAPDIGASVMLGGYSKDHVEELMADQSCQVLGLMSDHDGYPLIRHSCTATHGVSGAPLLVHDAAGWTIGGIEVVGGHGAGGGASVLYAVQERLAKLGK